MSFVKSLNIPAPVELASLPMPPSGGFGRVFPPRLTIRPTGQVVLNGPLCTALGGVDDATHVYLFGLGKKREVVIKLVNEGKAPKGLPVDKYGLKLNKTEKNGVYFSASGFWRLWGYSYKESGSQGFEPQVQTGECMFILPEGALTPPPVIPRKPKAKAQEAPKAAQEAPESDALTLG